MNLSESTKHFQYTAEQNYLNVHLSKPVVPLDNHIGVNKADRVSEITTSHAYQQAFIFFLQLMNRSLLPLEQKQQILSEPFISCLFAGISFTVSIS